MNTIGQTHMKQTNLLIGRGLLVAALVALLTLTACNRSRHKGPTYDSATVSRANVLQQIGRAHV